MFLASWVSLNLVVRCICAPVWTPPPGPASHRCAKTNFQARSFVEKRLKLAACSTNNELLWIMTCKNFPSFICCVFCLLRYLFPSGVPFRSPRSPRSPRPCQRYHERCSPHSFFLQRRSFPLLLSAPVIMIITMHHRPRFRQLGIIQLNTLSTNCSSVVRQMVSNTPLLAHRVCKSVSPSSR